MDIPTEFIERTDGKYIFLSGKIYPSDLSSKSLERFGRLLASLPPFHAHFGGAGDALLLLSSFYDDNPGRVIL